MKALPLLLAAGLLPALALRAPGAEPAIIAKARAYLGTEEALARVHSIHYSGTVVTADSGNTLSEQFGKVDIIFQQPMRYRQVVTFDTEIQTVGLDDFDGWKRVRSPHGSHARVTFLEIPAIASLRVDVRENLDFYRGAQAVGGDVVDQGPATVEGVDCEKVAFIYGPDTTFIRYFDRSTGRMVETITDLGVRVTYSGEIAIAGVRFPTIITKVDPEGSGQRTARFNFSRITLNEPFPATLFAMPADVASPSDE